MGRVVDIRLFKVWASRSLSVSPILRQMILSNREALSVEEFIVKVDLRGRLLREETARKRNHY